MDFLTTYNPTSHKKRRVGKDNDGGYIIIDGLVYDCIITAGIQNDVSFEQDINVIYPKLPLYMYDNSIDELPNGFNKGEFRKEKIAADNVLKPLFDKYKNILVKMDVEGWENHWFPSLPDSDILKIKQLVIEWHGITYSEPTMKRLALTHDLVHVHANNYGGFDVIGSQNIPRILECTYVRKGVISVELNRQPLPSAIDMPNNKALPDLDLNFKPFVNEYERLCNTGI